MRLRRSGDGPTDDLARDIESKFPLSAQYIQDRRLKMPQLLMQWDGAHGAGVAANSFLMGSNRQASYLPATASARTVDMWHYRPQDHDVPGYEAQFTIQVQAFRNGTAPGNKWWWSLWRVTGMNGGGVGVIAYTMAGAFQGVPRCEITSFTATGYVTYSNYNGSLWGTTAENGADDRSWHSAADIGLVDTGSYGMGVNVDGTSAANSYTIYCAKLFRRWVPLA